MKQGNFTGISGIPNQDIAMWESMGPISDRSKERVGASDVAVVAFRRLMVEAARTMRQQGAGDRDHRTAHPRTRPSAHTKASFRRQRTGEASAAAAKHRSSALPGNHKPPNKRQRNSGRIHDEKRRTLASRTCGADIARRVRRRRAGHGEAGDRPARQLGHLGVGSRPACRHLQEARPGARDRLHQWRGRNPAGGDLGQRRYRHRRRRDGRAQRLFQGRAGARDRRGNNRRQ